MKGLLIRYFYIIEKLPFHTGLFPCPWLSDVSGGTESHQRHEINPFSMGTFL